MNNNENLRKTVGALLGTISQFSQERLKQILEEADKTIVSDELKETWEEFTKDVGQSRIYCKALGVKDYSGLPEKDMNKIRVFTLYLVTKNPSIILPY